MEWIRKQLFADEDGSWFDKVSATKAVGMRFTPVPLPADAPLETVISTLRRLGRRRDVHGIMLELPLPPHLYEYRREIWASIDPRKVRRRSQWQRHIPEAAEGEQLAPTASAKLLHLVYYPRFTYRSDFPSSLSLTGRGRHVPCQLL